MTKERETEKSWMLAIWLGWLDSNIINQNQGLYFDEYIWQKLV